MTRHTSLEVLDEIELTRIAALGLQVPGKAADPPRPEERQSLSKTEMKMAEFDRLIEEAHIFAPRKDSGQVRKKSREGEDGTGMARGHTKGR